MSDQTLEWIKLMAKLYDDFSTAELEGYSPDEMIHLFDFMNDAKAPIKINILPEKAYEAIPLLNQICLLMSVLKEKPLALTQAGYLPPKLVKELYYLGPPETSIELGTKNSIKEQDTIAVHLALLILKGNNLSKIRNNKLSLTKQGEQLLNNKSALLQLILITLATRFNWGYFDLYDSIDVGKIGFGFSLILLAKYGQTEQLGSFYADKYFAAYPGLINKKLYADPISLEEQLKHCYCVRTFERYLAFMGLVNLKEEQAPFSIDYLVQKTPLFDQLITVLPPKTCSHKTIH